MQTPDPTRRKADDYAVFEIVNPRLHEIFIGVAPSEALHAVPLRLPVNCAILHWGLSGLDPVRGIATNLSQADAYAFASKYVQSSLPSGWRYVV